MDRAMPMISRHLSKFRSDPQRLTPSIPYIDGRHFGVISAAGTGGREGYLDMTRSGGPSLVSGRCGWSISSLFGLCL
jgi:hypothetical protein